MTFTKNVYGFDVYSSNYLPLSSSLTTPPNALDERDQSTAGPNFTSTVGKKPTAAANYVNDVEDVHELLESLVKVTTRETVHSGFYSVVDLKKMDEPTSPDREAVKFDAQASWQRSLSMCQLHTPDIAGDPTGAQVSTNLDEYLGTMEEDGEDDDNFF